MKLTSLHKTWGLILTLSLIFISQNVFAGLSGFTSANPYTREEQILHIETPPEVIPNYRDLMRDNVMMLSTYAKGRKPNFTILVHEGVELLNKGLWEYHLEGYNQARKQGINANDPSFLAKLKELSPQLSTAGTSAREYQKNIDGVVLNNYFCGKSDFVLPENLKLISIDKCPTEENFDEAIQDSVGHNALLYGFTEENFAFKDTKNQILINENAKNISNINEAQNILFLLDESLYSDKFKLIEDIRNSNFDTIVLSPFFQKAPFSKEEIHSLKFKKNGTQRQVFAIFNITEANDTEYYWKKGWKIDHPEWLKRPSLVEKEGIIVEYWNPQWQKIISKYFKGIVDLDFDGTFLTGLENHRYFEKQTPLE